MNFENSTNTSQSTSANEANHMEGRDYFAWARTPGFNPMKLATVVAGFAVFPPLGAAALLYFIWNGRRGYGRGWGNPAFAASNGSSFNYGGRGGSCGRGHHGRSRWTGNRAFDEHQAEVMQNLRAEREAFWAFRQEQRRQRDQQAYDAFRASAADKAETPRND